MGTFTVLHQNKVVKPSREKEMLKFSIENASGKWTKTAVKSSAAPKRFNRALSVVFSLVFGGKYITIYIGSDIK